MSGVDMVLGLWGLAVQCNPATEHCTQSSTAKQERGEGDFKVTEHEMFPSK